MLNSDGPLDPYCVPTIPQTTECQVYLQTILLHLAALFGELFPQKCKHHYPQPSMGKSNRVGCIQDTKMQCARLKSKQPDELKRSALCEVLKSDQMLNKHVRRGYSRHYSLPFQFPGSCVFLFVFRGFPSVCLFPFTADSTVCIRARVSNSFIILDSTLASLSPGAFLFHLMPVLINVGSRPCTQKVRY